MREDERLAVALADAMLAGPWGSAEIRARTRRVIGRTPSWLTALVTEVLIGYLRPPSDRPRELAAFVLSSASMGKARRATEPLPRPVAWLFSPTEMIRHPFPIPTINDVGQLAERVGVTVAELDVLADTRLRARRAASPRIAHYRYRWLLRATGARLLEAPKPRLARLQRVILDDLLAPIPVHPAAHGFVAGRSAITGAAEHVGSTVVIGLDLEHFFAAITAGRINGTLRAAGYPEPVAHVLTGVLTHASPVSALSSMPAGADPGRDFRLRRRLAVPHLPQGAPTSPQLANLVAYSLDRRLEAYAQAAGARYTRYADDLTFSGGPELATRTRMLIRGVETIVRQAGFRVNPAKTRQRRSDQRQVVTGIVVNETTNVPRRDFDLLKAIVHDCLVHGPAAANRHHHPDFRAHLLGRIAWVGALNPARGQRLRTAFDAIDWTG